jgi:hypothetical protein
MTGPALGGNRALLGGVGDRLERLGRVALVLKGNLDGDGPAVEVLAVEGERLLLLLVVGGVDKAEALRPADAKRPLDNPRRRHLDAVLLEQGLERVVVHREGERSDLVDRAGRIRVSAGFKACGDATRSQRTKTRVAEGSPVGGSRGARGARGALAGFSTASPDSSSIRVAGAFFLGALALGAAAAPSVPSAATSPSAPSAATFFVRLRGA